MPETPPCPHIDKALLDHLAGCFRSAIEIPTQETSAWDIGARSGRKAVLAYLERRYLEQKENPETNVLSKSKDSF